MKVSRAQILFEPVGDLQSLGSLNMEVLLREISVEPELYCCGSLRFCTLHAAVIKNRGEFVLTCGVQDGIQTPPIELRALM